MKPLTASVLVASIVAVAVTLETAAFAHDMGEMGAMGSGDHDMGNMSAGEMEAMHNQHDSHLNNMKNMSMHMDWTKPRTATKPDQERAAELVDTLRTALAKYKDYHVAEADGFKPFHPEFKRQAVVHFTRTWNAIKASFEFDPANPTSLLYRRTPDGGYELIGAMYTAPKRCSEDQLDARVPLSVARWHRHINLCFPPKGADMLKADWTRFGTDGSIADQQACDAAGGRWVPQLFGWMVHVYPWEQKPQEVWAH